MCGLLPSLNSCADDEKCNDRKSQNPPAPPRLPSLSRTTMPEINGTSTDGAAMVEMARGGFWCLLEVCRPISPHPRQVTDGKTSKQHRPPILGPPLWDGGSRHARLKDAKAGKGAGEHSI